MKAGPRISVLLFSSLALCSMPSRCEGSVIEALCSSVTDFLNDEAAKTDADLKACKDKCGWKKRKDDLVDAASKKAKESCSKGEAPDVNELSKGLDRNTKDRLKGLYDRNSRMFDGKAKLEAANFGAVSSKDTAITGKGGGVTDLKSAEPDTPKLTTVSEFSLAAQSSSLTVSAIPPQTVIYKAGAPGIDPVVDCEGTIEAWLITNPEYAATCKCSNGPNQLPVCGGGGGGGSGLGNWIKEKAKDVALFLKRLSKEIPDRLAWRKWGVADSDPLRYATVLCNGKGGYDIQLNKFKGAPCGIEQCVKAHEQMHIDDANSNHQAGCTGVKPGNGALWPSSFVDYMECRAHDALITCLGAKISDASFFCMGKLETEIKYAKADKEQYNCSK